MKPKLLTIYVKDKYQNKVNFEINIKIFLKYIFFIYLLA